MVNAEKQRITSARIDQRLRVAIAISTDPSDMYFANELSRRLNVVGVIVEQQMQPFDTTPKLVKAIRLLGKPQILAKRTVEYVADTLRSRFAAYESAEYAPSFGIDGDRLDLDPSIRIIETAGVNQVNDPQYIRWLAELEPDVLAVCGTSILASEICSVAKHGTINLHGGLSQWYRGLFTTEWAVYNEEPEFVGATVHFVSPGVDDGDVIYQARPDVSSDDHPNSLYTKVVNLGIDMVERAIVDLDSGVLLRTPLPAKGKLYLRSRYTPAVKRSIWKKVRAGVIDSYLANKSSRDQRVIRGMINPFPS